MINEGQGCNINGMDILFIHGNYPAQFVHLASGLAASGQHRIYFLTDKNCTHLNHEIAGVNVQIYEQHREPSAAIHPYLATTESAILNGQAVVRAINQLQTSIQFKPRLVFSHAGNGLGLFIRELCPGAAHISYTEWYFRPELAHHLLGSDELDTRLRAQCRNFTILQELEACDVAVTPTRWQRSQFPPALQSKIEVIFDGVDLNHFTPPTDSERTLRLASDCGTEIALSEGDLVLTYATRGMEPLRGFTELMRALPPLLQRFPQLRVVIAGKDRRAYSYDAPSHDGSWKDHLLAELAGTEGLDRVHFTGLLNYGDYRELLWRSDVHVYFTRPYVLSWGFMQAAACGCRLLVNDSPAIADIPLTAPPLRVNLEDQEAIVAGATTLLKQAISEGSARRTSLLDPAFALPACLAQWQLLINQILVSTGAQG
jgi:glycosyltransferase involved in cell wall biosynthesis